jgi:hypothetical protein
VAWAQRRPIGGLRCKQPGVPPRSGKRRNDVTPAPWPFVYLGVVADGLRRRRAARIALVPASAICYMLPVARRLNALRDFLPRRGVLPDAVVAELVDALA